MRIESLLMPKEYLSAVKNNMSSSLELGMERFTGFFLGRLFYVTHHCCYEWDRQINNPKNAALGFVKASATGCDVHFITFRGAMCPLVFLPLLLCMLAMGIVNGTPDNIEVSTIIALVVTVLFAPISAFIESTTIRSEDAKRALLSMLVDPTDPLANYNNV